MKNLIAKLIAIYKLAADATEEQIIAEVDKHQTLIDGLIASKNEMLTALGLKADASIEEAKGMLVATKNNQTSLQTVTQELAALKLNVTTDKFNAVIAKGMQTGRITPAQKENADWLTTQLGWAKSNFTSFEEYFTAKAPVIIPIAEIKVGGDKSGVGAGLTETDLLVAKNLGVKKEDLEKYNQQVN